MMMQAGGRGKKQIPQSDRDRITERDAADYEFVPDKNSRTGWRWQRKSKDKTFAMKKKMQELRIPNDMEKDISMKDLPEEQLVLVPTRWN